MKNYQAATQEARTVQIERMGSPLVIKSASEKYAYKMRDFFFLPCGYEVVVVPPMSASMQERCHDLDSGAGQFFVARDYWSVTVPEIAARRWEMARLALLAIAATQTRTIAQSDAYRLHVLLTGELPEYGKA